MTDRSRKGVERSVSLLRKTFVLGMGAGAARLLGAAILVVLARILGVEKFGIFNFAMSVALLLGVAIDMGQSVHIGRLTSRDAEDGALRFGYLLTNKTLFSLVAAAGAWMVLRLAGAGHEEALTVAFMVVWGGFLTILDSERAVARAVGMYGADSIVNSTESVGRLLGVLVAAVLGLGLVGFGAAFAIECAVAAIVFYFVLARRVRLAPPRISLDKARRFLAEATPLGLAGIASVGFYQLDQVFVRTLAGPSANGLYGAATRIVFAANGFAGLVAVAAYPDLARAYRDRKVFRARFAAMLKLCVSVAAVVSAVALLFAEPIVRILYGSTYAGTVPLLRILAPVVLLDALVVSGVNGGNALGREKRVLVVVAGMLVFNAVANWVLVPRYGAYAAAWISTLGEGIFGLGVIGVCWDHVFPGSEEEHTADTDEEAVC